MADDKHAVSAARPRKSAATGGWKHTMVSGAHLVETVIGLCCRGTLLLTGLSLLVILTAIVALRYTNGVSIDSGAELTALIFPVFVMAGIAEAARQGAHIATQITLNALNDAWRLRLVLLIHSVTAATYLYLTWFALRNAVIAHDEQSTILRVPGSVGYGSLAIGLGLVGICSLAAIVRHSLGHEKVVVNLADATPGVV
jgi:TRAP-type C4-dicarboxylate transport system permease small subunit